MANPKYESVTEMERVAAGEDDDTCNMRLRVSCHKNEWLRVVWFSTGCRYYHDVGRRHIDINRQDAQNLIDREWGKLYA